MQTFVKLKRLVLLTIALTLIVIVLGAYTRLKDAGLGCPDWPGCYGRLIAPTDTTTFSNLDNQKAWIEMIHRYVAGTLGILILLITISCIRLRKKLPQAWIWSCAILGLVIFQALLGMWTVTLRLYPMVVMGHLLGGMAILGLLAWLYYCLTINLKLSFKPTKSIKLAAYLSLIALILQLALGGWTSANYAGVVCADFPTCQGQWWPNMNWTEAFNLTAVGIFTSPGIPLENTARITIQMAHRLGALLVTILFVWLSWQIFNKKLVKLQTACKIVLFLLATQIILGVCNVLYGLPLFVSLLHNFIAALLLVSVLYIVFVVHLFGKQKHVK